MSSKKSKDERLPDGWVLCCSKSNPGRKYYFNKKTGKSSWTQPEASSSDKKMNKKERNRLMEKKRKEEQSKKGSKRKSDGDFVQSPKRKKHESKPSKYHEVLHKQNENSRTVTSETESPTKSQSHKFTKSTPTKVEETPKKLKKNLANARLSQLRTRLSNEADAEETLSSSPSKKRKSSPNESVTKNKHDKSPSNDSKSNQSPNESLHSIPSPSQFFAANKIISSMKAQLPEEYCNKDKQKDTFADIEKGICSQTPEYPFSKHPATPPQFSEASKLVSAIKSKLAYRVSTPKESRSFSSAKDRMDALRADLSSDLDSEHSFNNTNESFFNSSQLNSSCGPEAMEIEEFREIKQNSPNKSTTNENNVVLVVDTNIFIHELDIIKDVLNSHLKGYREQPTLLVPWRVINELDRLKDNNNGNGAVCKRAKAAMDYLYKSLPENSRIKGQSLRDANSHIYPCEIPDDEILNCSLQQLERGKNVLLVSNDKNLRNKAQINSVQHIGIKELRDMLENKPQPAAAELFAAFVRLREAIYPLLANILENEMRAKYDNLWQYVLFKEPPWTLADVLQCLLKHWIAVFNEVFPRIEHLITDLKRSLLSVQNKDPKTVTQSEVTTFKELCLDVARRCQIIPEYMQLAKTCVERLLRDGATETEDRVAQSASDTGSGNMSGSGIGDMGFNRSASEMGDKFNRSSVSGISACASDLNDRLNRSSASETGDTNDPRTQAVVEAFESLWTVCSSYCAKLATSAGVVHNIEDKIPGEESLQYLTGKWNLFTGNIDAISRAIHGVTMADDLSMDEALNNFERTFNEAMNSLCIDKTVARHELRIFCIKCRNMLHEASSKFSQLSDLLVMCKNRLSY